MLNLWSASKSEKSWSLRKNWMLLSPAVLPARPRPPTTKLYAYKKLAFIDNFWPFFVQPVLAVLPFAKSLWYTTKLFFYVFCSCALLFIRTFFSSMDLQYKKANFLTQNIHKNIYTLNTIWIKKPQCFIIYLT